MHGKIVLFGGVEQVCSIEKSSGFQHIKSREEWERFLSGSSEVALIHAATAEQAVRCIRVDFGVEIPDGVLFAPVSELSIYRKGGLLSATEAASPSTPRQVRQAAQSS